MSSAFFPGQRVRFIKGAGREIKLGHTGLPANVEGTIVCLMDPAATNYWTPGCVGWVVNWDGIGAYQPNGDRRWVAEWQIEPILNTGVASSSWAAIQAEFPWFKHPAEYVPKVPV